MEKCFVTFLSPGTIVSEMTIKPIDSWDVETAKSMAGDILERYDATPYGFYFTVRSREVDELDSKETQRSCMYYLGGTILTLEEIIARNDSSDRILISNMESNKWNQVIENNNSWGVVQPFCNDDVLLEWPIA